MEMKVAPNYTKAPVRHRPRRIQRKIDRRFGLLHYDRAAIYILSLQRSFKSFDDIVQDGTLDDLGKQILNIVKEANDARRTR